MTIIKNKKQKGKEKMKKDIVTIHCYGKAEKMEREKAKAFYLDCMMNSEGSERDRYTNIYCDLVNGLKVCSDGEEVYR